MSNSTKKKGAPFKVLWERALLRYSGAPLPARAVASLYATYASADGSDIRPGRDILVEVVEGLSLSVLKKWTKYLAEAGWLTPTGGGYGDVAKTYRLSLPEGFDLAAEEARERNIRQANRDRKRAGVKVETEEPGGPASTPEVVEPAGPIREPAGPVLNTCGSDPVNLPVRDRTPTNASTNTPTNSTTNTEAALTGRTRVDDVWAQVEAEAYERNHYEVLSTRHLLERIELRAPVGAL
ncbi:hypothetical protein ACFTZJ_11940 [Streptomyces globisporus]|uniref:hypothetical protein n=1 Tax=Streptomyces globisporus TaxID=1908 RepID=UPI003625E801